MHSDQVRCFYKMFASKLDIYILRHSAQRDKPLISYLFCIYNLPIVEEKDGLFFVFFLSFFFFLHDGVNRWSGKVLPMFAQQTKKKAPRFRPRKRSQSIIIYSHYIAQAIHIHTRTQHTHTSAYTSYKDYFRLMGL